MELREYLFAHKKGNIYNVAINAQEKGVFAGSLKLAQLAAELSLTVEWQADEGYPLEVGSCVFRARGKAAAIIRAEEILLGCIGKASGVATAAARFIKEAKGRIQVVCGAWKKVPQEIRQELRRAIATGGAGIRITEQPFVYLDKNYVRIMGGIEEAVTRAKAYDAERLVVVQIRGEYGPIDKEAVTAVLAGANILMVDTGDINDLQIVAATAQKAKWGNEVKLAFAGGVTAVELETVIAAGADIVDVGRAIIDAPLLDYRLDVEI